MEKQSEKSCFEWTGMLAARTPVPGGGGASALAGALGASLCSMVANYTLGKPKYARVEPEMADIRDRAEGIRVELLDLMDADARAFLGLSEAYALPKTEAGRRERLERAARAACEAPLGMIDACGRALDLLSRVLEEGNGMLVSDTGCGAALCRAAMESASLNVFVNTRTLRDRDEAARIDDEVRSRMDRYGPVADRIVRSVRERLDRRGDA